MQWLIMQWIYIASFLVLVVGPLIVWKEALG